MYCLVLIWVHLCIINLSQGLIKRWGLYFSSRIKVLLYFNSPAYEKDDDW
jgi:hypothetical protein